MGSRGVPPGFRFHPTDEELLFYYLRSKVLNEPPHLDVIRELHLNMLEPWDLNGKCRIGSGPQNEWYFFSHNDKKYPTGSRANRATAAGFWKATGRDKAIHLPNSNSIGLRKTLVFYTGRAPRGQKADWIMHEYRLDHHLPYRIQEAGWVGCKVFRKNGHPRGLQPESAAHPNPHLSRPSLPHSLFNLSFHGPMHLLQLLGAQTPFVSLSNKDHPDLLGNPNFGGAPMQQEGKHYRSGAWFFLDKLLASTPQHNP